MFIGNGDSSWAIAPGGRTQTGKIVVATTTDALRGHAPSSILDWRSARTQRVVRSTLAAEAIACDKAYDHAHYVAFFEEGLYQRRATLGRPRMPCVVATDCRSLHDVVQKVQRSVLDSDLRAARRPAHQDRPLLERCTNFMMDSSSTLRCENP